MWYSEQTALEKNAARNRGSASDWFQHKADYNDPSPKTRTRPEAQKIVNKHSLSQIPFDPRAPPDARMPPGPDSQPAMRLRGDDAAAIASKQNDPPDRWYDFEGNLQYAPDQRKPRVNGNMAQTIADKMTNPQSQDWYKHKQFKPDDQMEQDMGDHYQPGSTMQGKFIKEKMTRPADWFAHQSAQQVDMNDDYASADGDWRPPRTTGAGSDFAVRNIRGTSSDWILTHDPNYADERPAPRLAGQQANTNSTKHNGSAMKGCLTIGGEMSEDPDVPPQRIQKSAEANYMRNRGVATQLMTGELEVEPNMGSKNLVGQLANSIAERHRGQMGNVLDQSANTDYQEDKPLPRAPTTVAQMMLDRGRGTLDFADTSYRSPADDRKVHPRGLQSNATDIAERHKGGSMQQLVSSYQLEPDDQPAQRVNGNYARQNAAKNAGTGWSLLAHDSTTTSTQPANRLPPAAQRVVNRQASGMSKTLQMVPPTYRSDK